MIKVKTIYIEFFTNSFHAYDITKMRAFLAAKISADGVLHHHLPNGKLIYKYPQLQIKKIKNKAVIVGFGDAFPVMTDIFTKINYLDLHYRKIELNEKSISVKEELMGLTNDFIRYRFASPWMALNQENARKYMGLNPYEREMMLNRILWGNLRTLAHAFEYWIPDQESVKVNGHFKKGRTVFKDNNMITFTGDFVCNFYIPGLFGLGKQVARGFGTVLR